MRERHKAAEILRLVFFGDTPFILKISVNLLLKVANQ